MRVLNVISLLIFLCFLIAYCFDLTLNFQNFPIADDYEAFFDFNNRYFALESFWDKIRLIFSQHNEHRIATLRIINLSYYFLFGEIDLEHFRYIGLAFYLFSMVFLFLEGNFTLSKFYCFLPVPILMLSFAYAEIYFLAMESLSHLPMIFFTVATFYTAINKRYTFLPLLFLTFGVFSNGNGILLMPLVFVGLLFQRAFKRLAIWGVFSMIIASIYFQGYESGKSVLKFDILPYLFKVLPIYIGGIGGFGSLKVNLILGVAALILMAYFVIIKKSYKQELSLTLMLAFYVLTFLIISVKRSEYGMEFLQRGAYLVNSVMIFVLLYIMFYKISLKGWLVETNVIRISVCGIFILLGCLGYQFKNYRSWIEILKYDEAETRHNEMMYLGNTFELYQDKKSIYNIPLVSYHRIDDLVKKRVYNLTKVEKSVVSQPFDISGRTIRKLDNNFSYKFKNIAGFDIKENPYLRIRGNFIGTDAFNTPDLGLVLESKGKRTYFLIPKLKTHLKVFKQNKAQVFEFEFLFLKKYLKEPNSRISIFQLGSNSLSICDTWHSIISNIDYDDYQSESKIDRLVDSKKFNEDTLSKPILEEAFSLNSFHELVLNLQNLKHTNKASKFFLIFHGQDGSSFLSVLKPFDTEHKERVFYTKFEFEQVEKFLKKRNSVFKLELLVNTNGEMFVSHLESLYYFYSKDKVL